MTRSFDRFVVKAHEGKTARELADAPCDALSGVSAADHDKLKAAFGIDTVRDLAENKYFERAGAITAAAFDAPSYDPGPPRDWERRFAAAPLHVYTARPDLFRIDFGPVYYRGRLDGSARLLVVGQDPSVNEILAQRIFVGQSGQKLQGFLAKLGLARSYLMFNTFRFSIFHQFGGDNRVLSRQDPILAYRNGLFDAAAAQNPLEAVLTVGAAARDAVDRWPELGNLPRADITHPAAPDTAALLQDWNQALATLRPLVSADDGASSGPDYGASFQAGEIAPIPRHDLPFGVPDFHGDGDHGKRDGNTRIVWSSTPL